VGSAIRRVEIPGGGRVSPWTTRWRSSDAVGERPILVGHSLGGLVAQRVAELGRARAIALLAPAPPGVLTAQAIALPRFAPNVPRIMTGRPFIVGNDAWRMTS
jgi:pimeloyl-ACP methyl ester carboxylesterase